MCFVGGVLRPPSSYGFFTMTQEYSVADLAGFRQTVGYAVYAFVIVAIYFLLSLFRYTLCLCVCGCVLVCSIVGGVLASVAPIVHASIS